MTEPGNLPTLFTIYWLILLVVTVYSQLAVKPTNHLSPEK